MTRRAGSLLVLLATLVSALGTSEAENLGGAGPKDAVLYELMEQAVFTEDGFRNATSALEGKVLRGTPLCPDGLQAYAKIAFATVGIHVRVGARCTVVAIGQSQIRLSDFTGQIAGDFWVVVNSDATNLADAQELVIMNGTFAGDIKVTDPDGLIIDILPGATFTPVGALPGFPVPPTAAFSGKFRLPFFFHNVAAYKSDRGTPVPVRPDERALGDATVRVEISFD
jgi:hypothetical protein